jgi:hypothetical protein
MWQGFKGSGGWTGQQWRKICPIYCKLDDVIPYFVSEGMAAQSQPVCIILKRWTISKVTSKWLQGAVFVKRLTGIPRILWKAKVQCCGPNSLPLVGIPILSQASPVYSFPLYVFQFEGYHPSTPIFSKLRISWSFHKHKLDVSIPHTFHMPPLSHHPWLFKTNIILHRRVVAFICQSM